MDPNEIRKLIEEGLPGAKVMVDGDGRHFEAAIVSAEFAGKPMIKQHRMVYATLGERFANESLHALSIKTYTPEQWDAAK